MRTPGADRSRPRAIGPGGRSRAAGSRRSAAGRRRLVRRGRRCYGPAGSAQQDAARGSGRMHRLAELDLRVGPGAHLLDSRQQQELPLLFGGWIGPGSGGPGDPVEPRVGLLVDELATLADFAEYQPFTPIVETMRGHHRARHSQQLWQLIRTGRVSPAISYAGPGCLLRCRSVTRLTRRRSRRAHSGLYTMGRTTWRST
jgi:hypothetical protein